MLEAIRRAISVLRQKQVLHKLGVAVSVTVIGAACFVLYHMLRGMDVDDVLEAIKETEPHQIVLAGLFVASGRRVPRTGGVILARSGDELALLDFLARDPFAIHGAARFDVVEFSATKTSPGLEALKTI